MRKWEAKAVLAIVTEAGQEGAQVNEPRRQTETSNLCAAPAGAMEAVVDDTLKIK